MGRSSCCIHVGKPTLVKAAAWQTAHGSAETMHTLTAEPLKTYSVDRKVTTELLLGSIISPWLAGPE
jgi:hypothetical protein